MEGGDEVWQGVFGLELHLLLQVPEGSELDLERQGEAAAALIDRLLRAHDYRGDVHIRHVRFTGAYRESAEGNT
jgi:hypothetical protein